MLVKLEVVGFGVNWIFSPYKFVGLTYIYNCVFCTAIILVVTNPYPNPLVFFISKFT